MGTPEESKGPVDLADHLARQLYDRNAKARDLIGGSNAQIFKDAHLVIGGLIMGLRRANALLEQIDRMQSAGWTFTRGFNEAADELRKWIPPKGGTS